MKRKTIEQNHAEAFDRFYTDPDFSINVQPKESATDLFPPRAPPHHHELPR